MNTINEKKTLTVSILGKSYSLVTDEEQGIIEHAAQHVESLMERVVHPATSPAEAAKKTTFVALQIAVDLLKKHAELDLLADQQADLVRRMSALDSLIKESLN